MRFMVRAACGTDRTILLLCILDVLDESDVMEGYLMIMLLLMVRSRNAITDVEVVSLTLIDQHPQHNRSFQLEQSFVASLKGI
jgi:hypothetical protein